MGNKRARKVDQNNEKLLKIACKGILESVECSHTNQTKDFKMARRLIHTASHTAGTGTVFAAKVYRDSEWNEYVVSFHKAGKMDLKASYHTSDKSDAVDTANYHCVRMSKQFA